MNGARKSDRVLVYENDSTVGANMIAFFAIGTFVFSLFLAWYVSTMTSGGQPAPLAQRLGFALVIAGMGAGFLAWTWLHNHKVIRRIYYREVDDILELEHPALFFSHSTRDVPMAALENANFHSGDPQGEQRVNVPWVRIGVHHGRTFIINLPGQIHRYDVFGRLLERAGLDAQDAFSKQAFLEQHG